MKLHIRDPQYPASPRRLGGQVVTARCGMVVTPGRIISKPHHPHFAHLVCRTCLARFAAANGGQPFHFTLAA